MASKASRLGKNKKYRARSATTQTSGTILTSKSSEDTAGRPPCGLYVVATPIGNLQDISARALETLRTVAVIACEDTRVTGTLLHHFGISTPMTPYHDHNALRARPQILKRLSDGEAIALVSDAGTPLLSDPGYQLVRACANEGIAVFAVPGPSALLAALAVAGLPTDRVLYAGFLPVKSAGRRKIINEISGVRATLVFYESAQRLVGTLADLSDVLGARDAAVCRELTKLHEEVQRGTLSMLAAHYKAAGAPKGEVVIVISPPAHTASSVTNEELDAALRDALSAFSLRDAVDAVAGSHSQPRRVVYARAIALKKALPKI